MDFALGLMDEFIVVLSGSGTPADVTFDGDADVTFDGDADVTMGDE